MRPVNKKKAFAFIAVITASILILLTTLPAHAQTTNPDSTDFPFYITYNPALAIPEVTIQLADHSYDVPSTTTTSIDPYTGKETVTTQPGYHIENKTIEFTIPNQPHRSEFLPHYYGVSLYYDIRVKGHFTNDWTELFIFDVNRNSLPVAPNASYTTISIPQNYPADGLIDFQIRAINGTVYASLPGMPTPFCYWRYQASGWSSISTLDLSDGSVSTASYVNPTLAPTVMPNPTAEPTTYTPTVTAQPTQVTTETATPKDNASVDTTGVLVGVIVVLFGVVAILAVALFKKTRPK